MNSDRAKLAKIALHTYPLGAQGGFEFSLQNYISENQEAALAYVYDGKPLSESLSKYGPDPVGSSLELLKSIYPEGEGCRPEAGAVFNFLLEKDQVGFLKKLVACATDPSIEPADRLTALRGLAALQGETDFPDEMTTQEALDVYTQRAIPDHSESYIKDHLLPRCKSVSSQKAYPPVQALALLAGADRPWVRQRLESSADPDVWYMTNVANFNTSPQVAFSGFLNLARQADVPHSILTGLYTRLWQRPDFVSFMRTKQALAVEEGPKGAHTSELKQFVSFSPRLRELENPTLFQILDLDFDTYQPPFFLVAELKSRGLSDAQAGLRAGFATAMVESDTEQETFAAARRLLGLSVPVPDTAEIRQAAVPARLKAPSFLDRVTSTVSGYISAVRERFSDPRTSDINYDYDRVDSQGVQSWEHKDQLVKTIESTLAGVSVTPRFIPDPVTRVLEKSRERDGAVETPRENSPRELDRLDAINQELAAACASDEVPLEDREPPPGMDM